MRWVKAAALVPIVVLLALSARFVRDHFSDAVRIVQGRSIVTPQLEILETIVGHASMHPNGKWVAYRRPNGKGKGSQVVVIEVSNGKELGLMRVIPPLYAAEVLWNEKGGIWVRAETRTGTPTPSRACTEAFEAHPPDWVFVSTSCSVPPRPAIDDRSLLPKGAFVENRFGPVLKDPKLDLFAFTVFERKHPFGFFLDRTYRKIADTRLLDKSGRFVAQIGETQMVGWGADGSLIALHSKPWDSTSASLVKVPFTEIRRLAQSD